MKYNTYERLTSLFHPCQFFVCACNNTMKLMHKIDTMSLSTDASKIFYKQYISFEIFERVSFVSLLAFAYSVYVCMYINIRTKLKLHVASVLNKHNSNDEQKPRNSSWKWELKLEFVLTSTHTYGCANVRL